MGERLMMRRVRWSMLVILGVFFLGVCFVIGLNAYVKHSTEERILSVEEAARMENMDCILVLGCGVEEDGTPSDMLRDRLDRSIEVYQLGAAPKLLMSGDHGRVEYNEVGTMKQYAIGEGILSQDIFMDHAGFSTYESLYRAKEIFCADRIIIVTQKYHLYRALYIAEQLGIEAYGVASDQHTYGGQMMRDIREVAARCKDFATTMMCPRPTYLGERISIQGDGDLTNDY
ncbi:MAG TPA: YdcF family protein [Candidatus Faecimorpha stercoravium]|nr:YdcF family protein [Candidatus Faecimorpha stercoravium]